MHLIVSFLQESFIHISLLPKKAGRETSLFYSLFSIAAKKGASTREG